MPLLHRTIREILSGTEDAAFAVDWSFRILYANGKLLRIIGRSLGSVQGRPCSEVVRGCRLDGEPLCGPACPIVQQLQSEEQVQSFDMAVAENGGGLVWLNAGGLRAPADWSPVAAVFLLRRIWLPQVIRGLERRGLEEPHTSGKDRRPELTPRELKVLSLLTKGGSTEGIASELWISPATVRNHVRSILRKLGVHSRAEAVARAFRQGLVET